jgi:phage terminase large subunit-like protein
MSMWSTAGTPESKAMLRWREQGIRAIDSGEHGPLYFAEYSPPSNIDPMTPEAWEYANPALGHTLDMSVIKAEAKAPNRNAFLRGSVNTWTSSHSGWLENGLWEACLYTGEVPAGGVLAIEQSIDEARYVGVRAVRVENKTVITTAFDVDNMAEMWACVDREVERAPQLHRERVLARAQLAHRALRRLQVREQRIPCSIGTTLSTSLAVVVMKFQFRMIRVPMK